MTGDRRIFHMEQQIANTAEATQVVRGLDAATFGAAQFLDVLG